MTPAEMVASALAAHPWNSYPRSAHRDHEFDSGCAVCKGDVEALANVAVYALTDAGTRADVEAERTRIARHFADMTVTREWRRRFEDRHAEQLANGVTVRGLLSAVADEIKGLARDTR